MEIYFDNSATTRPYKEVCDTVADVAYNIYGNPSSLHTKGMEAEKVLRHSRKTIADKLGCREDEVYFTSGGTESSNMAIFGVTSASRKRHIIITAVEHPCIMNPFAYLEGQGYKVTYVPVDQNGFADLDFLESSVCDDTALVCMMQVNNEVGAITDISKAQKIIRRKNPGTYFFVDAVQAFGKIPVSAKNSEMISISSHKIHGPKGVGALYIKKGTKIHPHVFGGGQEKNLRSGTENVPAIAGFAKAVQMIKDNSSVMDVKKHLADRILSVIPDTVLNNTDFENSAAHVLNISFPGARSEVLLHFLESRNIYVSSGSACSSNKPGKSHVLTAMGKKAEIIDSSIRFSFCAENTIEEADICVEALKEVLPQIRRKSKC